MTADKREDEIDIIKTNSRNKNVKIAARIIKDIIPHIRSNLLNRQDEANQIIELLRPFLLYCWTTQLTGVKYEW